MSNVAFASASDLKEQKPSVIELASGVYGYISDFDPNSGFAVTTAGVLSVDTRATPMGGPLDFGAITYGRISR